MYCQKCRTPLKADNSIETLNPAAFDLLVGSASRSQHRSKRLSSLNYPPERQNLYDKTTQEPQSPTYKRNIPAPVTEDASKTNRAVPQLGNPDMSFIEITESQVVPIARSEHEQRSTKIARPNNVKAKDEKADTSLSWQVERNEKLFSILSSYSDIDHPVCSECSMMLVSAFNARLTSATRERDAYASFLKSLQHTSRSSEGAPEKDLDVLMKEEREAFEELVKLEEERNALESELAELDEESGQLDMQEEQFWKSRNTFDNQLHDLEVDLTSLQQKYAHDLLQLERLQRTNVYNDTFCIGHDGYFGTINGLRLGRLPAQNVEWAEINAAWGQTLLLLSTIAERLSFVFQGYRLRPLGSTSRIEKLEWPQQPPETPRNAVTRQAATANPPPKVTQLDLFSSGDMPLGRVFNHRRFDAGMAAFLECLAQLGSFVEKASRIPPNRSASPTTRPNTLVLPYTIDGDKIGGVSIRLGVGFSQDENFTKACKYALTCCKFLLAHVSNLESTKGS